MSARTVFFERLELDRLFRFYGRMVAQGEWRDYALDALPDCALFSIYRRASEAPPAPDSFEITSANRSSRAPAHSDVLPRRDSPSTATRLRSTLLSVSR